MDNRLHASVLGNGPNVVLLHGLFGQGSNLASIARALCEEFTVYSLDLPDHGRSFWSERASIQGYAQAVASWMTEQQLPNAHVVGHSLGGKVAMQLALTEPDRVRKLVVADIAPLAYAPSHQSVLKGLANVALQNCSSRRDAADILRETVDDEAVVQFLLLSLKRDEGNVFRCQLNREGLSEAYARLSEALHADGPFAGDTLFLRGALSDYVKAEHERHIARLFPHYRLETIDNAGHWLHAEQAQCFNRQVVAFLR